MKPSARVILLAGAGSPRRARVQALLETTQADRIVRVASTGAEVIAHARAGEAAVILDDLPDHDHASLPALLGRGAPCAVVVLLAAADPATELLLLQLGADECLSDEALTTELLLHVIERASARSIHRRASHAATHADPASREAAERETQLDLALEASSTGLWTWDMTTDTVTWSIECYRIHGVDRFDGSAPAFFDLVHPDDRERVGVTVRSAAAEHRPYWCEFRIIRPNGEIVWVENRGRAFHDASDRPIRMLGTITDVTARKRAESAAREAQALVQGIIDGANALVYAKDLSGRYFLFNRGWLEFVGLSPERARGMTDEEIFGEHAAALRENDRKIIEARAPLVTKESARMHGQTLVHLSSKFPLLNERGEVHAVCGVSIDVTEAERIQRALATRERELQTLTDNSPDIFTRFDPDLRHVFVNSAVTRATGLPRDAFIGKTNRELGMPSTLCDLWEDALRRVFEQASPESLEFAFDSGDRTRLFEARLVPEFDEAGRVTHVLGVTRDVSERHRYEQALREADRRKDEFMATLAHELRNPFATLANGLEVLKRAPSGEQAARARAAMERQLRHCTRLIEDLLDASGIALGKLVLRSERVSLRGVVDDALESTRGLVEAAAHSLQLCAPSEPIYVRGDAARLTQVVSNLVTNAAKYTPPGGTIAVNLSTDDALVELEVSDSGVGIPPEMLDQVFVLFSQLKSTGRSANAGLGIGLAVVKRLVELQGGSVAVRSEGSGRGTTFTVRLPLHHDA